MGEPAARPRSTLATLWHDARDIDGALAERLGLTGPEEAKRRAWAWGLAVLGVLLVALVLSPVVAGGQPSPDQVAPAAVVAKAPADGFTQQFAPPPTANSDRYRTAEDAPLVVAAGDGVLANDRAAPGGFLVAQQGIPPSHGELALAADGSFTYTPDPDFAGSDTFSYHAYDVVRPGLVTPDVAVLVVVVPAEDTPVARPDGFTVAQDTESVVDLPGVLANDVDVDGDDLAALLTSPASRGSVDLASTGGFRYRPEPGFVGLDSFTYAADDGLSTSRRVQVTLEVVAADVAPDAAGDGYVTPAGEVLVEPAPGVLANDEDPDGDPLSALIQVLPASGTVELAPDGGFSYVPAPDFTGLDRFSYVASDGTTTSEPATVTIVVGGDDAFPLVEDAYGLDEDTTLAVPAPGVLANDDVGGIDRRAELVRAPASGVVELRGDGSFLYVPDPDVFGEDSFEYVVVIGEATSTPERVLLAVQPAEEPPEPTSPITSPPPVPASTPRPAVAAPPAEGPPADDPPTAEVPATAPGEDAASGGEAVGESPSAPPAAGDEGAPSPPGDEASAGGAEAGVIIDVAGPLADELGQAPVVSVEAPPPDGRVSVNGDGTVTYVPAPGFLGRDSFGYRACTLDETCTSGTIEVMVSSGPEPEGPPDVRFQNVRDENGVPWLLVALAMAVLVFAVAMAVVVIRAVRGPADPFAGADLPPATPPVVPGP